MNEQILNYLEQYSSEEPSILKQLNRATHLKNTCPRMLSGHIQGRLLAMLSKMIRPKAVLEIGTYTGYSALCLAEGLAKDGILHTIEVNPELEETIKFWIDKSGYSGKIIPHIGDAILIAPALLEKHDFSLVFLDAEKGHYDVYYKILREKLKSGAIILVDNVLWDGKVIGTPKHNDSDTKKIASFNKLVKEDDGVEKIILPLRDGLSIIRIL